MKYPRIRPDWPAPDPDLIHVAIRGAKNKGNYDYKEEIRREREKERNKE